MNLLKLSEIKRTTWNLKPLFKSDNDPEMKKQRRIIKQKSYEFINRWKNRDDYLKDPAILKQALDEYEQWQRLYCSGGNEWYYFVLRSSQDQEDSKLKAKFNKISEFSERIWSDIEFFELRIAEIPSCYQKKFLQSKTLKPYKNFLEASFAEAEHSLSEAEEKILGLKSKTSHANWVSMVSDLLTREEREILLEDGSKGIKSFSEIHSLINSQNKKVRDSAAMALNEILEKHVDVAEAEINSILENKKINDELRKMPRPDYARHMDDGIDSEVVDVLIKSVSDRFDIPARYYELKAKLMGVEKLKYYERNISLGKIDKKYPYKKAVNLIYRVFENLDKKFADILFNFIKNGYIDVYPRKGKSGGGFCSYYLISQPIYILLNYTEKLEDVLTFAHELGHGINNELMKEKQNAINFGAPFFTAEVASIFMESFVLEKILKEADDKSKLAIMMEKLNGAVSSVFRQIAFYKFEQELHKKFRRKGYLSKKEIGKLFKKHLAAYMGEFVELSPGTENDWVHIGHFRRFFYVHSYASGLLISKSLQSSVKNNPKFIKKVKEFLSTGYSDSPEDIFKKLGIDITKKKVWDKGLTEVENLLEEATMLAQKLGKIKNF